MGTIAPPSYRSLFLNLFTGALPIASATGFVIVHDGVPFLVSNWHVFSGRNPRSGRPESENAHIPTTVEIWHNVQRTKKVAQWAGIHEALADEDGTPLWFEHPTLGARADVAALPLTKTGAPIILEPYDLPTVDTPPPDLWPGDSLSVVGFPYGQTVDGRYAIWTNGTLASDFCVDFEGTPSFLIDARTRKGQSGSPVMRYASPGTVVRVNGAARTFDITICEVLGVYAGRLVAGENPNDSTDLGRVWRASAIWDVINGRQRATVQH